jgi:hypothetical protein
MAPPQSEAMTHDSQLNFSVQGQVNRDLTQQFGVTPGVELDKGTLVLRHTRTEGHQLRDWTGYSTDPNITAYKCALTCIASLNTMPPLNEQRWGSTKHCRYSKPGSLVHFLGLKVLMTCDRIMTHLVALHHDSSSAIFEMIFLHNAGVAGLVLNLSTAVRMTNLLKTQAFSRLPKLSCM